MKRAVGLLVGVVALAIYLNFALGGVALPPRLGLFLALAIGPAAIVGTLGLFDRLGAVYPAHTIRTGGVFLIIAFALMTLMVAMQQATRAQYMELRAGRAASATPEALELGFDLANQAQLGADVAFDLFYSLGIVITSSALIRRARFPRLLGAYGLVAGSALLLLNLATFPTPPAEAGAFDLGPATVPWWIGLLLLDRRTRARSRPADRLQTTDR